MSAPQVKITKTDGNTGATKPSAVGILAIIAASQTGTANVAGGFGRQDQALSALGYGPLVEDAAYAMAEAGNPVVLIKPAASVAGAYGTFTTAVSGSSAVATTGTPLDEFNFVRVTIVAGGTVGTPGITYTYSLDSGVNVSGVTALGAATTLSIPNTGVAFTLGAGTLLAGDTWTVPTTRPQPNNSDLVAALEALRVTSLPWENVLIDADATSTTVNTVDAWLAGLEQVGSFHGAFLSSRHKLLPVPTAESEATFAAAMATQFNPVASIRLAVGTDAGDLASQVTGVVQPRPMALALAVKCAQISVGTDPAFVATGPVPFGIDDASGNPKWHDEQLYPGLDDLRLSTLRSLPQENGTFITNGNVLSPGGSDYVFVQHFRCMNAACNVAYQLLTQQLSRGVGKQPPNPVTGAIYILEQDAAMIETIITSQMRKALLNQVVDVQFVLARNDDLSANSGATVHGQVEIEALAYLKKFLVQAKFVKAITVGA